MHVENLVEGRYYRWPDGAVRKLVSFEERYIGLHSRAGCAYRVMYRPAGTHSALAGTEGWVTTQSFAKGAKDEVTASELVNLLRREAAASDSRSVWCGLPFTTRRALRELMERAGSPTTVASLAKVLGAPPRQLAPCLKAARDDHHIPGLESAPVQEGKTATTGWWLEYEGQLWVSQRVLEDARAAANKGC